MLKAYCDHSSLGRDNCVICQKDDRIADLKDQRDRWYGKAIERAARISELEAQLATVTSGRAYLAGWKVGAEESAEAMRREFHAAQAFGAEQVAEVERLRAGLEELADGQCGSAYGNGCDGACQRFAGKVLRGEWQPPTESHP